MQLREKTIINDELKAYTNTEMNVVCPQAHVTTTFENLRWAQQEKTNTK